MVPFLPVLANVSMQQKRLLTLFVNRYKLMPKKFTDVNR